MMEKAKILYHSPEAAQIKTITGWVSSTGHFYGDNEDLARYAGSTHRLCDECGNERKTNGWCHFCQPKRDNEKYNAMPFKEWDGEGMLVLHSNDLYFNDFQEAIEYCENDDINPEDLQLVICEPNYAFVIDADDYYCDILPDGDSLEDRDQKLADLIYQVNKYIRESNPIISWGAGKYRTSIPKEPQS